MANLEKIVEDLSSLTVLEAAELAKLLEEKWGVSAAAAVAVAAAPGAAAAVLPARPAQSRNRRRYRANTQVPMITRRSPSLHKR